MPADAMIVPQSAEQASGSGQAMPASYLGTQAQGSMASQNSDHGNQCTQLWNPPAGMDGGSPRAAKHLAAVPKRRRRKANALDGAGAHACSVSASSRFG
jgi:hypothetical protein